MYAEADKFTLSKNCSERISNHELIISYMTQCICITYKNVWHLRTNYSLCAIWWWCMK